MEINATIKNSNGYRVHIVVDGRRYTSFAGGDVILPQDTSLAFYSTMKEATLNMDMDMDLDLDLHPRRG